MTFLNRLEMVFTIPGDLNKGRVAVIIEHNDAHKVVDMAHTYLDFIGKEPND